MYEKIMKIIFGVYCPVCLTRNKYKKGTITCKNCNKEFNC